jgi:receptor protein-tyrosine kinase
MLRANLRYFNVDHEIRSLIVTSPQPGDGKSTVSWNLASAAASAGTRVLLIEADLRRPALSRWTDQRPKIGLSALLSQQGSIEDAVVKVDFGDVSDVSGSHSVDVIFAGGLPPNPDELMESDRMREVIRAAEAMYGLVVIDTPPTSVVSDAIPLVIEVSGVLVVSRLGRTTRGAAATLAGQLANLNARVLGVVVNGGRSGDGYGYGYGYSYGSEAVSRPVRVSASVE